jgi:FkbM family methyltransferase
VKELRQAWTAGADARSRLQLSVDVLLYRFLSVARLPPVERCATVTGGVKIIYRLNRGDIQSVREIWFDEGYKLPFDIAPRLIVDLGANIGMTSLWYSKRYACPAVIAVEPSAENAKLLRKNFAANGIEAVVIEAAVGSRDGKATFLAARDSNLGTLAHGVSAEGVTVPVVSMRTVLQKAEKLGRGTIDLLKIDIEGGETDLLSADTAWLGRVGAIVIEFHPDRVDYWDLVNRIKAAGLQYVPGDSVFEAHNDSFVRGELSAGVRSKVREKYAACAPEAEELQSAGVSRLAIAEFLNARGRRTGHGKPWDDVSVSRVLLTSDYD